MTDTTLKMAFFKEMQRRHHSALPLPNGDTFSVVQFRKDMNFVWTIIEIDGYPRDGGSRDNLSEVWSDYEKAIEKCGGS